MKIVSYLAMLFVTVLLGGAISVHAQTFATMPVLYDQNGVPVNTGGGPLAAGYYWIGGDAAEGGHQVDYYGNGVYYDLSTQTYGGSVADPNGTAGVSLNYVAPTAAALGVPNTGVGGMAASNWLILIISAAAFVAAVTYGIYSAVA